MKLTYFSLGSAAQLVDCDFDYDRIVLAALGRKRLLKKQGTIRESYQALLFSSILISITFGVSDFSD